MCVIAITVIFFNYYIYLFTNSDFILSKLLVCSSKIKTSTPVLMNALIRFTNYFYPPDNEF